VSIITVQVESDNVRAVRLFKRCGFGKGSEIQAHSGQRGE